MSNQITSASFLQRNRPLPIIVANEKPSLPILDVRMHRNPLMMRDCFASLEFRARKCTKFFEMAHSSGFNSPSIVGINSLTVG
jgi:hypothetical protein